MTNKDIATNIKNIAEQSHSRSRAGLYKTVWPLEHADTWRTQTSPVGGLPAGFSAKALHATSIKLDQPIVGYTREQREVFVMGGMPFLMNTYTQDIMNNSTAGAQFTLEAALTNLKHTPYVAKIDPVTLEHVILPLTQGQSVNYPGGMLMHENGFVYAVAQGVLYKIAPDTMQIVRSTPLPLVGQGIEQELTAYNGLQVLSNGLLVTKCFVAKSNPDQGWLLKIDPDNLSLKAAQLVNIQSARLMLDQPEPGVAYAYAPTLEQSRRFRIVEEGFVLDEPWSAYYRRPNTTWANGTLFMKNHVVFPDNSAPGANTPMHIYLHPVNNPPAQLEPHNAVSASLEGINFWKVLGDPYSNAEHGTIVTFVPMNSLISAYRLGADGSLKQLWERSYMVSASPAIVTSTDHLYINDYRDGHDHFVVLRLSTGEELARVALPAVEPTMGIIFPGMNNDAYLLSTETGCATGFFNRIYVG